MGIFHSNGPQTLLQYNANLCYRHDSIRQDHHDDIRQEQKWEMQALSTQKNGSSSSNSSSTSTDDAHEHNLGCDSLTCETASPIIEHATTMSPSSSSSCGNHSVENCNFSQQHQQLNFSGNTTTVAINNNNNNNCDMVKNNNSQTPIEIASEGEAAMPAAGSTIIDQQNALLRGANIGEFDSFGKFSINLRILRLKN